MCSEPGNKEAIWLSLIVLHPKRKGHGRDFSLNFHPWFRQVQGLMWAQQTNTIHYMRRLSVTHTMKWTFIGLYFPLTSLYKYQVKAVFFWIWIFSFFYGYEFKGFYDTFKSLKSLYKIWHVIHCFRLNIL